MNQNELALMKAQLKDMRSRTALYEAAFKGGYVCAGFGGELNGVNVPNTLLQGRLPPGTTPHEALEQVIAFMEQTILQAEQEQKKKLEGF